MLGYDGQLSCLTWRSLFFSQVYSCFDERHIGCHLSCIVSLSYVFLNRPFHNADVRCSWLPWRRLLNNLILMLEKKMSWQLSWLSCYGTKIYRFKKQDECVSCLYSDCKRYNEGFALFHLLLLLQIFVSGFEGVGLTRTPGCICLFIFTFSVQLR